MVEVGRWKGGVGGEHTLDYRSEYGLGGVFENFVGKERAVSSRESPGGLD